MVGTAISPALEGLKHVKSENGVILTMPFLDVCSLILPVLDKFGGVMSLAKSDIESNISSLKNRYMSDPSKYEHLYSMVQVEVQKNGGEGHRCTVALLWLTRAMDFVVKIFQNLLEHPGWPLSRVCTDSYEKTLKKWHGWLASIGIKIAMKLAPDRRTFMEVIGGSGDVNTDMAKLCAEFSPILAENHKFLASVGFDNLRA